MTDNQREALRLLSDMIRILSVAVYDVARTGRVDRFQVQGLGELAQAVLTETGQGE